MELNLKKNKRELLILAQALSNEKRLELLEELTKNSDLSHKALAEKLNVRSSSISFHISQLIDADLIKEETTKGLKGRNKKTPKLKINKIVITL